MRRRHLPFWIVVLLLLPAVAAAQSVEVLGLRHWTVGMLRDSLRRFRPDIALGDAACGDLLRDSLHFPDAAVLRFRDGRVVLSVIEPSDSQRVVLRPAPDGAGAPAPPVLQRLVQLLDSAEFAVEDAIATWPRHAGASVPLEPSDSAAVRAVWSLLADAHRRLGIDAVRELLLRHADPAVRRAAASVLVAYGGDDGAWRALVRALRDPDWGVRTAAHGTLRALRQTPRRIDWSASRQDLRHLLDGTTLVFHTEVVSLLVATEVDPALAPVLLSPAGGALLLEEVQARHEYVREPAHALLVRLSGADHGTDWAAWRAWLARVAGPDPTP